MTRRDWVLFSFFVAVCSLVWVPLKARATEESVPAPRVREFPRPYALTKGGAWIEILGDNFRPDTRVLFGEMPAQEIKYYSPKKIYAIAPEHPEGTVSVTLSNAESDVIVATDTFEYVPQLGVALELPDDRQRLSGRTDGDVQARVTGGKPPYQVSLYINGRLQHQGPATDPSDVCLPARYSEGQNFVFVLAQDSLGYLAWGTFHYLKDSVAPCPVERVHAYPASSGGAVTLGWTASPSPDVDRYGVEVLDVSGDSPRSLRSLREPAAPFVAADIGGLESGKRHLARVVAIDRLGNQSEPTEVRFIPQPFLDGHDTKRRIMEHRLSFSDSPKGIRPVPGIRSFGTPAEIRRLRREIERFDRRSYTAQTTGGANRSFYLESRPGHDGPGWEQTAWNRIRIPEEEEWDVSDLRTRAAARELDRELDRLSRWVSAPRRNYRVTQATASMTSWGGFSEFGWEEAYNAATQYGWGGDYRAPKSLTGFYGSQGWGDYFWSRWSMPGDGQTYEFGGWSAWMFSDGRTLRVRFDNSLPIERYFWTDHGSVSPGEDGTEIQAVFPGSGRPPLWDDPAHNAERYEYWEGCVEEWGWSQSFDNWGRITDNVYAKRWNRELEQEDVSIRPARSVVRVGERLSVRADVRYCCSGWGAGNGRWEPWEPYRDTNRNGRWDPDDDFTDRGVKNGERDAGEPFTDENGNGQWDAPEPFTDYDRDGQYDPAEPFTDTNGNGCRDYGEWFWDMNWNGRFDPGEWYWDANGNGSRDPGEPFTDLNDNGWWDWGEPFTDLNDNGVWDEGEAFTDEDAIRVAIPTTIQCTAPDAVVSNHGGSAFVASRPGTYTITTPQGGSSRISVPGIDLDVGAIEEKYERRPGGILAKADLPDGEDWGTLSTELRNELLDLAKDVTIRLEVDEQTEEDGQYVLSINPGALLLSADGTEQILPTAEGAYAIDFQGSPPASNYKILATEMNSNCVRISFHEEPIDVEPSPWHWWYGWSGFWDGSGPSYQLHWWFRDEGPAVVSDHVRLDVMDLRLDVLGCWAYGGSVRRLDAAVDHRNRRIYVGLPGDWDPERDEGYIVVPGAVDSPSWDLKATDAANVDGTPISGMPEFTADLRPEASEFKPSLKDSGDSSGATALFVRRPGRYQFTIQADHTLSAPTTSAAASSADAADDEEEWELVVIRPVITQTPDYLFANADYATSIRFTMEGLDGLKCKLLEVQAQFLVNGTPRFEPPAEVGERTVGVCAAGTLIALSDFDEQSNGYTYECYIPSKKYENIDIQGHFSKTAYFQVTVSLRNGITTGSPLETGEVSYFADISVPAEDISLGKEIPSPKPLPPESEIYVRPTRQCQAIKNKKRVLGDGFIRSFYEVTKETWAFPENVPMYRYWCNDGSVDVTRPLFSWVNLASGWHYSRSDLQLSREAPDYGTIVTAKNYGHREGAWINISYGGKDAKTHPALAEVLSHSEVAMDYDKKYAQCTLVFFQGGVEIEESVLNEETPGFTSPLLGAAQTACSIFLTTKGVAEAIGLAKTIYDTINVKDSPQIQHGAQAQADAYWRWEHPNGDTETDRINERLWSSEQNTDHWPIKAAQHLDTGASFFVFADISTRVQETVRGYFDFWGTNPPSPTTARCVLHEKENQRPYIRLYER